MRKIWRISFLALLVLVVSCGDFHVKEIAEEQVKDIRMKVRNGNANSIYEKADPEFRRKVKKEEFVNSLSLIADEMGDANRFVLEDWKVRHDIIGGTFVTLRYEPVVIGKLDFEEYIFKEEKGNFVLFNYKFGLTE